MKGGVMDANVTVEEMVAAIGFAARVGTTEPPRRLLAAQQYILSAEAQIAERDAQIAEMRKATDGIATFVEEQIVDRIGVVEARRVRLLIESRTGFEPRKNPGPQSAELGLTEANDAQS